MVSTANGPGRTEISPTGQLFRVDRRLPAGPELMQQQLQRNWAELLNSLALRLHPIREAVLERYPADYYWTCFQSEWATDLGFGNADFLKRLMPLLVRHGVLSFSSVDVMRYFGKK